MHGRRTVRAGALAAVTASMLVLSGCGGGDATGGGKVAHTGSRDRGHDVSQPSDDGATQLNLTGKSCDTIAPATELSQALGMPVRFEPSSGGNEQDGWACWYYLADATTNTLLVDVSGDAAEGKRMVTGSPLARMGDTGLGGPTYGDNNGTQSKVMVLRSNGYFSVGTDVNDGRYDLLLTQSQLLSLASIVASHLS